MIDAGASNGIWSHAVSQLFGDARFLLVDPLLGKYKARSGAPLIEAHRNFETAEVALSEREGEIAMQVSGDLFNSFLDEHAVMSMTWSMASSG